MKMKLKQEKKKPPQKKLRNRHKVLKIEAYYRARQSGP